MCLAIPMRLVDRDEYSGTAELHGVSRTVGLMLCPDAQPGDYVLIHAGYALATVDEEEARETLRLLDELVRAEDGS